MLRHRVFVSILLVFAGCSPTHPFEVNASSGQISTTLFFGLSKPDGTGVADADFDNFATHEIAARFPDGYTLLRGDGHWQEKGRDFSEPARILWIIHPASPQIEAKIEQLRTIYCRRFQQSSVLRMDIVAAKVLF